jgi:arginine-tRNA-protein transferase
MTSHQLNLQTLIGPHSVPLGRHSHECSYLPDRTATEEAWLAWQVKPAAYHELMNRGFRRSGNILYRTVCESCSKCIPIRIPVDEFQPSKTQRRVLRRNVDVQMIVRELEVTPEKHDVYRRYLHMQHRNSPQGADIESFRDFLYSSCVETVEIEYRDAAGKLLGVSICDQSERSLSSVYHYFEPGEARRSIGVYSTVKEIELCRNQGIPHYYLGYWVQGCRTMDYKQQYRPHELLIDGRWQRGSLQ